MAILSKTSALFALVNLLALVSAVPNAEVVSLDKRGAQLCGQWDTESEVRSDRLGSIEHLRF